MTPHKTLYSRFACAEYMRRIDDLKQGGYRLVFDTSARGGIFSWVARLVHTNGNVITLTCYPVRNELIQKTNGNIVYHYGACPMH